MICNCGKETSHIKVIKGIEYCNNCLGISENRATDGLLTRNASRIRTESLKFEGDMLSPRKYDKMSKKVIPNEDFIKRFGTKAKNFLTKDEIKQAKFDKLDKRIDKQIKLEKDHANQVKREVIHEGNASDRISELLKD